MLEGLKISLSKLKVALNIFACSLLILLLMVPVTNATVTSWFNKLTSCASSIMFPNSRIRFWSPDDRVSQPLQGQAVIYLDKPEKFVERFRELGWSAKL